MREDTGKLLEEAQSIMERSRMLRINAEWVSSEIGKVVNKTTEEKLAVMDWEEKERHYKLLTELEGRLLGSVKDLFKLDAEHRKIVERVNAAYGRAVMEELPPLKIGDLLPPEEV